MERAENYARFIDVNANLALDLPPEVNEQWGPLLAATGDLEAYNERYDTVDRKSAIYFLAFDPENPNSLYTSVTRARENARIVRENLTSESWEILNSIYLIMKESATKAVWKQEDPRGFFINIKYKIQLLYGITYNSVARTEGWYWTTLGQYLERADKTSRILDVKYHYLLPSPDDVGTPLDHLHWMALLKSVSGFNIYRRTCGPITPAKVVEFLVLNRRFPRSIYFCLTEGEKCLHKISGNSGEGFNNSSEKMMGTLRSQLEYDDVKDVIDQGLHEYLDHLQKKINDISEAIYDSYFGINDNFISQMREQQ